MGEVLYEVTPTSGTVRLRDPTGNLLDLDCRIRSGDGVKTAQHVVLDEYDAAADVFLRLQNLVQPMTTEQ